MLGIDVRADAVLVHRVRLRGAVDQLRARRHFELALSEAAPSRLVLPPRALLVVRRLAPAVPLRFDAGSREASFLDAVRAELADRVQRARRPWLHADASSAAAVWFEDEAELIACLVRDWLRGAVAERWWWRAFLRGVPTAEWLRRYAVPRGDLLPAVLAHLAADALAESWLARWDDGQIAAATAAVATAHALRVSGDALTPSPARPAFLQRPTDSVVASAPPVSRAAADVRGRLLAVVPEVRNGATPLSLRRLLAMALALHRAPTWARTADCGIAISELHMDVGESVELAAAPGSLARAVRRPLHRPSAIPQTHRDPGGVEPPPRRPPRQPVAALPTTVGAQLHTSVRRRQPRRGSPLVRPVEAARPHLRTVAESEIPRRNAELVNPVSPSLAAMEAPSVTPSPVMEPAGRELIATEFGGLFYLLNVALALGLYGDFTQPRHAGMALSPWDWLALIGRAWCGEGLVRDPLWVLLAALAGRSPRQAPGADFLPPDEWMVPSEWLAPWGRLETAHVQSTRRRLRLWHAAGFVLIDVPRTGMTPRAQARALRAAHAMLDGTRLVALRSPRDLGAGGWGGRGARGRWLVWSIAYINARLARALGDAAGEPVASLVARHAATVACTATHVDVHLSLATLPLPIRIAGLDRDPGWIPAAGRTVAFHFA